MADAGRRADRPVQPAGRRPAQHQLRRRQHLGEGHRDRPGHRCAGGAGVGQGLRRRPGHADPGRAGRAAAGPAARAGRRLPGRGARGRDGRRVRLLPARQGRGGAVDRHRDARAGRRAARRPPAPRLGDRAGHRGRRGEAHRGVLRRPGGVGAVAAARASSSAWTSPRWRRRTRRRSAWSSAATASPRGARPARSARRNSLEIIADGAGVPRRARRGASRSARSCRATSRCPRRERRAKAAAIFPTIRGLASTDRAAGRPLHRQRRVLEFLAREKLAPLAELGTSCPDHFLRTKVKPLVVDLPAARVASRRSSPGCGSCTPPTGRTTAPTTSGTPARTRPPMRGADPAIVLVPGVGMFSFGAQQADRPGGGRVLRQRDQRDARRRVGVDATPRSRSRRSSASSTGPWRRPSSPGCPQPKPLATRVALVTGAGVGHRQGDRRAAGRRGRLRGRRRPRRRQGRRGRRRDRRTPTSPIGVGADVSDEDAVAAALDAAVLAFGGVDLVVNNAGLSISKPLLETTVADWDLQHDVMAKGSFLVSRAAAKAMIAQGMGGDIVYISSKNALFAGPEQHRVRRRRRPTRPTRCGCWPPSWARTASGSTASTRTASCAAPGSSPAAGAPSGPRSTACRRRSSAPTTPSARC